MAHTLRRTSHRTHPVARLVPPLLVALRRALARSRERRALVQLPDELLKDIGLTRREVVAEAQRPFWRR